MHDEESYLIAEGFRRATGLARYWRFATVRVLGDFRSMLHLESQDSGSLSRGVLRTSSDFHARILLSARDQRCLVLQRVATMNDQRDRDEAFLAGWRAGRCGRPAEFPVVSLQ